ncbi:hypothetical protein Syun_023587 [Stephania yunnanensis]|uniref:Uncharacterized protein n=1 Tax=Stephania yunnanensis TaxID=152371 RepID=A0AAP0FA26_9MAGN
MITYASTGRRSQLRYTENKWTMNLPADDGGLLKPDVVEGSDDEVPLLLFFLFSERWVLVFPIVLEGMGSLLLTMSML